MGLLARRHWLFDMDGTLTMAVHDFDAMRAALRLPPGEPILESLEALPPRERERRRAELDELERAFARQARAQPGARELLAALEARDCRLGIVTRNGREMADTTLNACGLAGYFEATSIIARDCCPPKPAPDGVALALDRWGASVADAVMVGDYRFDLEAGRLAGTATVHLKVDQHLPDWPDVTDVRVTSLHELHSRMARDFDGSVPRP